MSTRSAIFNEDCVFLIDCNLLSLFQILVILNKSFVTLLHVCSAGSNYSSGGGITEVRMAVGRGPSQGTLEGEGEVKEGGREDGE